MTKREGLTSQLKHRYELALNYADITLLPRFVESTKSFYDILIESFHSLTRPVSLFTKIKYLKFFNDFETLDASLAIVPDCYNHIGLFLTTFLIFLLYLDSYFWHRSFY